MRYLVVLALCSLLCGTFLNAQNASIETPKGVQLDTKLTKIKGDKGTFAHEELGEMTLSLDSLKRIDLKDKQTLYFQRSARSSKETGTLQTVDGKLTLTDAEGQPVNYAEAFRLEFQEYSVWNFSGNVGAVFSYSDGNTEELGYGLTLGLNWLHPVHEVRLLASANFAEENGVRSQQRGNVNVRYNYWFNSRLSAFAMQQFEHDDFKDLRVRSTTTAGATWRVVDRPDNSYYTDLSLGFSYTLEDFDTNSDRDFAGLTLMLNEFYRINETYVSTLDIVANQSLEESDDLTLYLRAALTGTVYKNVTLAVVVEYVYDNLPAANTERSDTRAMLVLGWNF